MKHRNKGFWVRDPPKKSEPESSKKHMERRSRERLETSWKTESKTEMPAGGQVSWLGGQQGLESNNENVIFILEQRGVT